MTKIEELERVMETEVEMGEALLQLLTRKQQSIVGLQSDTLTSVLAQEETLLKPFRDLESVRTRLTAELIESGALPAGDETRNVPVEALLGHLNAGDAVRISTMAARLRTVVERILHMNNQNRLHLQRSLRFVQDTLRLVTDDHTRQLVDHRV